MFDFEPSEEQQALIETARRFTRERIIPIAAECDREAKFPKKVFDQAHGLGLVNPTLPAEYGGSGLSDVESSFITEELAYGCSGVSTSMTANTLGMTPIKLGGTDEQKKKYLGWLAQEPIMASYATSEPGAGSDVAGLQCRATKDGAGGYVLNGTKQWITNATLASFYIIFATEDPALKHKGIGAFIVERSQQGVKPGRHEDKLGQRASDTAAVMLEDVRVPAAQVLAPPGHGFKLAMETFNQTRPDIGAIAVGIMRRCLDEGVRDPFTSSCAKAFGADAAMQSAIDAVQIFGGYGYVKDYPVEKLMRDAKILQIYEGTAQVQRLVIARQVIGK